MVYYTPDKLPYKYSVLLHQPQFRDEPCLEVIQRKEYFEAGILFTTLDKQQVEALEHLGVVISTDEPVFYSPAKIATLIESIQMLEPLADDIRRAGRVPAKNMTTCSRCANDVRNKYLASTGGEIPFCKDCIGVCRMCSRNGFNEELLEHGVCESCCLDMDEVVVAGHF